MYFESWNVCFWGARSRNIVHIFFVGTFRGLAPPPPQYQKAGYATARTYMHKGSRGGGGNRLILSFVGTCKPTSMSLVYRQSIWSTDKILKEMAVFRLWKCKKKKKNLDLLAHIYRGTSVSSGGGGGRDWEFWVFSVHVSRPACHLYRLSIWSTDKILKEMAVLDCALLKKTGQFDQKSSQPGTCTILVKKLTRISSILTRFW